MKKLFLAFLVLFMAGSISAQTITVELPQIPAPGATITVPLEVTAIDEGILTFQAYVQFDPAVLEYVSTAYTNPQFPQIEWVTGINPAGDEWGTNWFGSDFMPEYLTAPSVLCEITFNYLGGDCGLIWGLTADKSPVKGQTLFFDPAFGTFTATLVDGCVAGACPTPMASWTGAVDSDWFNTGNWDTGIVPDAGTDVTVPAGMPNDPVIVTTDAAPAVALANNVTSDAPISVGPLGYFTVVGMFTNNGGLTVLSDDTYNGSFIYDGALGGSFQYDRYISPWNSETGGWHYMSSPVAGFGLYNMYDYFVNTWDEATSMWMSHAGTEPCVPPAEIFNDGMEGWSVKRDYDYACPMPGTGDVVEFMGMPNWGDQVGAASASGVGMYPNFNLVGNPYPSYWNFDDYYAGANWTGNLFSVIYYWDEWSESYATYDAFTQIGVNGGNQFVPPVQGFFLEAIAADVLTFTEVERSHVYNVTYWKDATNLVRLTATANERTDETVIHFGDNFTADRDNSDARKLISSASIVPSLYTMAGDIALSINHMPETNAVPVYFECQTSGTYTIEANETSEFENVVLEDKLLGTQTDLKAGSYTFDYTTGESADRFLLHFTPLGIGDQLASNINIWSTDKKIFVQAPEINGDIVVYNMMGQEVVRTEIEPGLNTIPMNDVNAYFVVKVLTTDNAVTGKVFVK